MQTGSNSCLVTCLCAALALGIPFASYAQEKLPGVEPAMQAPSDSQMAEALAALKRHDYKSAYRLWLPHAEAGNQEAQYRIGKLLFTGPWAPEEVPTDLTNLLRWLYLAAESGHAGAQIALGDWHAGANTIWHDENGTEYWLSNHHAEAIDMQADYFAAAHWYRKAADQGDTVAQRKLGELYDETEGQLQFAETWLDWYRMAAEQGDVIAQLTLGKAYTDGKYGRRSATPDIDEAIYWFRKAADQGNTPAKLILGTTLVAMHYSGDRDADAMTEGAGWIGKAAEDGMARAHFRIGNLYMHGDGVPKDSASAITSYRKAANGGLRKAQLLLVPVFRNGILVERNRAEAARLTRLAAEEEYQNPAQGLLGAMYQFGVGVPHDRVKATKWFGLAEGLADGGNDRDFERVFYSAAREAVTDEMTTSQIEEARKLVEDWKPDDRLYYTDYTNKLIWEISSSNSIVDLFNFCSQWPAPSHDELAKRCPGLARVNREAAE